MSSSRMREIDRSAERRTPLPPVHRSWRGSTTAGLLLLLLPLLANMARAATVEPTLVRTPVRLAPSERQLRTLPKFPAAWHLSPAIARDPGKVLAARKFSASLIAELQARLTVRPDGVGVIHPDAALLDRFLPEERLAWMQLLALHSANTTYRWPVTVAPEIVDRLAADPRTREAAGRFRRWSSAYHGRLTSGDVFALEDAFPDEATRRSFYAQLLSANTLIARLPDTDDFDDAQSVDAMIDYWHVNGRHRAIAPILTAAAAIDRDIRIALGHFLPRLPRGLLHTYSADFQAEEDLAAEVGLMTARFFTRALEDGVELEEGFSSWLRRECVQVSSHLRFGDVVVYGDPMRSRWPFVAVYIADNVVFTRRPTLHGPWELVELDEIPRLNPRLADQAPQFYRRLASLMAPADPPFRRVDMPEAWRQRLRLRRLGDGPWGRLWCYDVLLAPPGALLEMLPESSPDPVWTFQGISPDELAAAIEPVAMAPETRRALQALLQAAAPDDQGLINVRPSLDLVLATPSEVRSRIFPHLVPGHQFEDYTHDIQLPMPAWTADWISHEVLPLAQREKVLPLFYPRGGGMALSDMGAFLHVFETRHDRLTAIRALFRTPALILMLERPTPEEAPEIARYWQLDQKKDIPQFLTSFARAEDLRYLDVFYLLPSAPRQLLNFYAPPTTNTGNVSCYWTALNFAAELPDERLLVTPAAAATQAHLAWEELTTKYDRIDRPTQFGDIIAYRERDPNGAVFHVCTYVAADVVYTKNGLNFSTPWCLMHQANVDALYGDAAKVEQCYFRLKDAAPAN